MNKKRYAKETLEFYFQLASKGGWEWSSDNNAEISAIIDDVIGAAVEEAMQEVEKRLASVQPVQLMNLVMELQGRVEALENAEAERVAEEALQFNVELYGGAE